MNYPGNPISQGAQNNAVSALQQQLGAIGYNPLATDGNFGPNTLKAVTAFQGNNNLSVNGIVGSDTWNILFPAAQRTINRANFFQVVKDQLFKGALKQTQVDGMTAILDQWENNYGNCDNRFLAYMLATTFHETAYTMQPIAEYGKGAGKQYGIPDPLTGQTYYGRGFVQLTWKDNYAKFAKLLNIDLVNNPDLAMVLGNAIQILFVGMFRGLFTSKNLAAYFNGPNADWTNARQIINGLDKAPLIAGYGTTFYSAISYMAA
jgi:putative chitinase